MNSFGKKGQAWLDRLPKIIAILSEKWSLTHLQPVLNMTWHYVAKGMQKNHQPIVLKVGFDQQTVLDEYCALLHFNGRGCIPVLAVDLESNALLLEQAIPGVLLKDMTTLSFEDKVNAYARVINDLLSTPLPKGYTFSHVRDWLRAIDDLTSEQFEPHFIDKAQQVKAMLLNTMTDEYLCHGDLHLENIIKHQTKWVAIDPKGVIGDIGFEAAAYDLINSEEVTHYKQESTSVIAKRIQALAQVINLDNHRLSAWVFLRVILSAQWFIEDKGDPSFMLSLAHYIYPLL